MQILKNLFAIGISIGLSDRQAFVKKVSGIIEDYQENPDKAEEWAQTLVTHLEEMKDDIRMQQNIRNSIPDNSLPQKDIEQLIKAVQDLTKELQQQKK